MSRIFDHSSRGGNIGGGNVVNIGGGGGACGGTSIPGPETATKPTVSSLRKQLDELLATGLYQDTNNDPVVAALRQKLAEEEANAVNVLTMLR